MKFFTTLICFVIVSLSFSSCYNDHVDFSNMRAVNFYTRNVIVNPEQVSFNNADGVSSYSLSKGGVLNVSANTFTNEDGTYYSGKVVMTVLESPVRGFMALNSIPTVNDGSSLTTESAVHLRAVDLEGHDLKIATGSHIDISEPTGINAVQNQMFYGDDNVKDPSPNNTILFNWIESSTDTVEYYWDVPQSIYFYTMKPTQLGWVSVARNNSPVNTIPVKVRVWGVHPINYNNAAVYLVPKNGKSAYRLWNYDETDNTFSGSTNYISSGTNYYVVVIATGKHDKVYFAHEEFTAGGNEDFRTVTATEATPTTIKGVLYWL